MLVNYMISLMEKIRVLWRLPRNGLCFNSWPEKCWEIDDDDDEDDDDDDGGGDDDDDDG